MGATQIIAIEPVKERLKAATNMGATHLIDVTGEKAVDAVLDITEFSQEHILHVKGEYALAYPA